MSIGMIYISAILVVFCSVVSKAAGMDNQAFLRQKRMEFEPLEMGRGLSFIIVSLLQI